jgi:hypothetical protein
MYFSSAWLLVLGVPLLQAADNLGIKMTILEGQPGLSNQRTIYLQGDRKRVEFRNASGQTGADGSLQTTYGPRLVSITRCDLGQAFELNLDASEYSSRPYPPKPLTKEELAARGLGTPVKYVSDKPTLRIEITTVDTGERKEMFGYSARHVITTRKQTPLQGSPSQPQESVTDGWYIDSKTGDSTDIDLHQRLSCDWKPAEGKHTHSYAYLRLGGSDQPIDRTEFVAIGEPEIGFAIQSVMTSKNTRTLPDGTTKQIAFPKFETRVVELEFAPLDPSLFEIPSGFRQVNHIERNAATSSFAGQPTDLWQRVKLTVASLFNH